MRAYSDGVTGKICTKCKTFKLFSEFYKDNQKADGLRCRCIECEKEYYQASRCIECEKEYYQANRVHKLAQHKIYGKNNREKIKLIQRAWRERNRERVNELNRLSRQRNKAWYNQPERKIADRVKHLISYSLKRNKNGHHWENLVGYTLKELMDRLESQFKPGMTWENYGEWWIDHIRPIASFNIQSYEDVDFKECWALKNLQPLWAFENQSKGKKYIGG